MEFRRVLFRSGYSKFCNIDTQKKLIHCVAIFTILYCNDYSSHGEFKLICIGKFARRTWVDFTQQYGKNRRRCQQNKFYYAVWQLLLYYYREFPSKILSVQWNIINRPNLFTSIFLKRYGKSLLSDPLITCALIKDVLRRGWISSYELSP